MYRLESLSIEEQYKIYKDLNNHDKYIFRLTDSVLFLNDKTIGYIEMTKEEKIEYKIKKEIIEAIRRNKEKLSSSK